MGLVVERTKEFARWLKALRDTRAKAMIAARIARLADGHQGRHRVLTDGICELKIDVGPGYRLYYVRTGKSAVLLLAGGGKSTQDRDIFRAVRMARELKG